MPTTFFSRSKLHICSLSSPELAPALPTFYPLSLTLYSFPLYPRENLYWPGAWFQER